MYSNFSVSQLQVFSDITNQESPLKPATSQMSKRHSRFIMMKGEESSPEVSPAKNYNELQNNASTILLDAYNKESQTSFKDLFSETYDLDYEPSELTLLYQFEFCGLCLSDTPNVHKETCLTIRDPKAAQACPESRHYMVVKLYKHIPPRVDGCLMADNQCKACQLANAPSLSFFEVTLCEKDLLGGGVSTNCLLDMDQSSDCVLLAGSSMITHGRSYSIDQISYCIEMGEDVLKVVCQNPEC